ncbi:HAMP domain-containing sensor histidine kinase [uncultured Vagococcus sp.]|uniref:HAMP domain-containing sensor histidine kinase n=1 Tax=uncultured Vagococcus sp. TaxID=189676 RepID=UPI0028D2B40E|nr:HAMP domain-containing sensor histidine kinase [uncultured Vagococcus sp.]
MKRTWTLRWQFVANVMFIMLLAGIISVILFVFLTKLNIPGFNNSPLIRLISLSLASFIIGSLVSVAISNSLLRTSQQLIKGTQQIARGDYKVKIPITNRHHTEINELIGNFNKMAQALDNVEIIHNDFINNFSHEFKTPIVSIKGFAKQLQTSDLTEAERQESIQIIISESERLAQLSSNILQLSNLENHEIVRLQLQPYNLDEQLRNCLLLLQQKWEEKNLILELNLEPVSFIGDQEMMVSLWLNLLNNAIKFSQPEGTLSVKCYYVADQIKVKISDTGIGMEDTVRQHVFDKFYQGDPAHQETGSGLGLAIARRIATLHHGKISVRSVLNEGTTFTVKFEDNQGLHNN